MSVLSGENWNFSNPRMHRDLRLKIPQCLSQVQGFPSDVFRKYSPGLIRKRKRFGWKVWEHARHRKCVIKKIYKTREREGENYGTTGDSSGSLPLCDYHRNFMNFFFFFHSYLLFNDYKEFIIYNGELREVTCAAIAVIPQPMIGCGGPQWRDVKFP